MNNFFSAFDKSSLSEWKDQIIKDLKGKEHSVLEFSDSIEELDYKAYYHQDEVQSSKETPGNFPYKRGLKTNDNNWLNGAFISIENESQANSEALDNLMKGADLLVFKATSNNCDWKKVLSGIQFEFIKAQFDVPSINDYKAIREIVGNYLNNVSFNFDPINDNSDSITQISEASKSKQHPSLLINGFAVQQLGATTWQEIAFCLNTGHEYLLKLMELGHSIDEASAMVHFHVGVGSNYFNEIAKFRALRQLWSNVIKEYTPKHDCTCNCTITAVIGHTNKSLRDPYTNLLRQTTETMSATNGADNILVLPYDLYSINGVSDIAKRTALNISLILKEESYFDKVIDPSGGSYSVETLTSLIAQKAWAYFQSIEKNGGLFVSEAMTNFTNDLKAKRAERIDAFQTGEIIGIGMNKYPDPDEKQVEWQKRESYLGINPIVFEMETKNSMA
jgi:methylmalonyl-CoA mutase